MTLCNAISSFTSVDHEVFLSVFSFVFLHDCIIELNSQIYSAAYNQLHSERSKSEANLLNSNDGP